MIGGGHGSYLALEKANLFHACSETELLGPAATFWPKNSTPNRGNMPSHKKKRIPGKSSLPADYAHPMGMGPMGYPHPGFWMQPGFFGFQGLLHT